MHLINVGGIQPLIFSLQQIREMNPFVGGGCFGIHSSRYDTFGVFSNFIRPTNLNFKILTEFFLLFQKWIFDKSETWSVSKPSFHFF